MTVQHDIADASADESWARGARTLCEMYRGTDADRFEAILQQLAIGRTSSVLAGGARWFYLGGSRRTTRNDEDDQPIARSGPAPALPFVELTKPIWGLMQSRGGHHLHLHPARRG